MTGCLAAEKAPEAPLGGAERTEKREALAKRIEQALSAEPALDAAGLQKLAEEVAAAVPGNAVAAERLAAAVAAGQRDTLTTALREVAAMLRFRATMEAKLPEGFPPPTPVGEIEVKTFPEYRLARTASKGDSGFWPLFQHIESRKIAMTAPVEMTLSRDGDKASEVRAMAFLYASTATGQAGTFEKIEVTDIPALTAVSIGLSGESTPARVDDAVRRLEKWLKAQDRYEAAGPARMMGYNSPFMWYTRRYFEVQIPVRDRQAKSAEPAADGAVRKP